MPSPNKRPASLRWHSLLLSVSLSVGLAQATSDLSFESAAEVNEGSLRFLETPPAQPGMKLEESTAAIRMEALFEGELQMLIQFEKP